MHRLRGALVVVVVSAWLASPGGASPLEPAEGLSLAHIESSALRVGDVVVKGTPAGDGCYYDYGIRTVAPDKGLVRVMTLVSDPACNLIVVEKLDADIRDLPANYLGTRPPVKPSPDATKYVLQRVWTYGFGGTGDVLSDQYGDISFSYNGVTVQLTDYGYVCDAPGGGPGWHWLVDACWLYDVYWGPGSIVWKTSKGSYHCNPPNEFPCYGSEPNGYYHTITDDEDGHPNGVSHCDYWWTGQVQFITRSVQNCQAV